MDCWPCHGIYGVNSHKRKRSHRLFFENWLSSVLLEMLTMSESRPVSSPGRIIDCPNGSAEAQGGHVQNRRPCPCPSTIRTHTDCPSWRRCNPSPGFSPSRYWPINLWQGPPTCRNPARRLIENVVNWRSFYPPTRNFVASK